MFSSGEPKVAGEINDNDDVHPGRYNYFPQHLVGFDQTEIQFLAGSITCPLLYFREAFLFLEDSDSRGCQEEENSPEQHELGRVQDSPRLQAGKDCVAHQPAQLLAQHVAGGGEPHVERLQHGQAPAVHGDVLGGRQEEQDGEHDGQSGNIRCHHSLCSLVLLINSLD